MVKALRLNTMRPDNLYCLDVISGDKALIVILMFMTEGALSGAHLEEVNVFIIITTVTVRLFRTVLLPKALLHILTLIM